MTKSQFLARCVAVCIAVLCSALLAKAGIIAQKDSNTYIAFEATTATLLPGTPETWVSSNIVSAAGGTTLYAAGTNNTTTSPHAFAHYQLHFKSAGTYYLYYRWKADETRTAGDNATANSCWLGAAFGEYNTPGDQSPFYRSDSNNQSAPADNTFAWRREPTVTYTVGDAELAGPVTFTVGTREAGMMLDRFVFSADPGLTDVLLDGLSYELGQVLQGAGDTFAAFSADGPVTLIAGTPESWVSSNIVNAVGGTALYSSGQNSTGDSPHSFAQYEIVFRTPGTYYLYYRWKADETRTAGDNATANSCWLGTTFGGYSTPGDQSTYYRSDSNNKTAPADNTFSWQHEPTATYTVGSDELAGPVRFTVGTREAGMTIDRFVFSTDPGLGDIQLDGLPDSGTQAPAPELVSAVGSESLKDVTVVLSRPLALATVQTSDFGIAPNIGVTVATLDPGDGRILHLTTGSQSPGVNYTLTVNGVTDTSGTPIKTNATISFTAWKTVSGWAKMEIYQNIPGTAVADLDGDAKYPGQPDIVRFVRGFQYKKSGALTDIGVRLTAWFTPTNPGGYDVFVNNDDDAEISLSSDATEANLSSLGVFPLHTEPFEEGILGSTPALSAGQKYLLRGVLKQSGGDAYLDVGVRPSGAVDPAAADIPILGGDLISVMVNPDLGAVTFDHQPADATAPAGTRAKFAVKIKTAGSPVYYQWRANGNDILGANRPVYITPVLTTADNGTTYDVVVSVAGISTPSRKATLSVTPGEPSNIQPYIGINYYGAGYVSEDAVSLASTDVAGVVLQENWNNLGSGTDPVALNDAQGAATPVTVTASTPTGSGLGLWSSGTRFQGDADGDLMQGFLHNGTSTDPVTISFTGVPTGVYELLVYTTGFDFQANYQEAFSVAGGGSYPTYHGQGETGLDYSQTPGYRRITNTDPASHPRGNYVQFDSIQPAADGSLALTVQWEAPSGGAYNPAINAIQLVNVLPITIKPILSAAANAGSLTIGWDANASGYTLQSSTALGPAAVWTTVTGVPNPLTGAGSTSAAASAPGAKFYRLVKN